VLLLIDEADRFIKSEVASDFLCVQTMLRLMAETKHRFKFVLAGLHNVSRIVRAENSPLVQISSNPLQIGPLLNRDVETPNFWSGDRSPPWASNSTVARTSGGSSASRTTIPS
jgi:hypothetical protein